MEAHQQTKGDDMTDRSDASPTLDLHERWLARYRQRFIDRAGLTPEQAEACARAEPFTVLAEGFEDDPEGAVDEEMSYWDWE